MAKHKAASEAEIHELRDTVTRHLRKAENDSVRLSTDLAIERRKREHAEADLADALHRIELFEATQTEKTARKVERLKKQTRSRASAIICCNDWHAEENVDPKTVDNANETSLSIISARIKRLWEKGVYLTEFARKVAAIDELVLWLGGDLINGAIHEELEESNFLGPAEAILFIQDHVHDGIQFLKKHGGFKSIIVPTSYGNHGRSTKKRRISTGYRHSWEWLAYNNLERLFRNDPQVAFKVERSYHNTVNVQGWDVRFHHGDAVRYHGGIGGVSIPLKRKIAQWNKRKTADLDVIGHFHQYEDDWRHVLCGCLVGYNAYAVEIGAEFQPPTQTFIAIDRERMKTMAIPIFVE